MCSKLFQFFISTSSETKYECDNDESFPTEIDKESRLPYDAIETELDEDTNKETDTEVTNDIYKEIDDPYDEVSKSCADPENLVRGGPNLKSFFFLVCFVP